MGLAESLRETYEQAAKEVDKKMQDFWARHKAKAAQKLKDVESGKITEKEYQNWLNGQVFIGERWKQKLDDITQVYVNADEKARSIINGTNKNEFVRYANAQGKDIKNHVAGYSFDLYDRNTVERLLQKDPKMLPEWKIDEEKDYIWNEKRVRNAVTQGIIQGEAIPKIAKRLSSELSTDNHKKMTMFARTAVVGAQNAGRIERMREAQSTGIVVKKKWLSTHDNRVRDAHAELDGQTAEVDEPFHSSLGDIMFPGDPAAAPANAYNCRCTLTTVYDVKASKENLRRMEGQTEQKEQQGIPKQESKVTVVQGKDISATWQRRADKFDFEIEDVINAQGFDGKPRLVDKDEFDKLVKQANGGQGFIAQRTYSAPDQETLDTYREMLYNGKWYVDCSTGGAQYGQGMYGAADYNGELTQGIKNEMTHYQDLGSQRNITEAGDIAFKKVWDKELENATDEEKLVIHGEYLRDATTEQRRALRQMDDATLDRILDKYRPVADVADQAKKDAHAVSYIETFTLDPSAKIITYNDLNKDYTEYKSTAGARYAENFIDQLPNHSEDFKVALKGELNIAEGDFREVFSAYQRISGTEEYKELMDILPTLREGMRAVELQASNMNIGSFAALRGYDAINAAGHGESMSYTVILNRTKVIFRRDNK